MGDALHMAWERMDRTSKDVRMLLDNFEDTEAWHNKFIEADRANNDAVNEYLCMTTKPKTEAQVMAEVTDQLIGCFAKRPVPTNPATLEGQAWGEYRAHGGKLDFTAWQEQGERA